MNDASVACGPHPRPLSRSARVHPPRERGAPAHPQSQENKKQVSPSPGAGGLGRTGRGGRGVRAHLEMTP